MATKDLKQITNIYAALTVSLFLTFLPLASAALLACIMFLGVWISAYVIRSKSDHDSLTNNHMTYIIRTIWISGLFGLITMSFAGIYVYGSVDPSVLLNCTGGISSTDMAAIEAAVKPCMNQFILAHKKELIYGTLVGGGPMIIYLAYRLCKGLSRSIKGHRIGDVTNWF